MSAVSGRSGLVLSLALGAVALRMAQRGKIQRAWAAVFGSGATAPASSPLASGASEGTGGTGAQHPYSSAVPKPEIFGVGHLGFAGYGESYSTTVAAADAAGLTAYGGGPLAHDYDYSAGAGLQPVRLPGGRNVKYQYLGNAASPGQWGNLEYFRVISGGQGTFGLPHLEQLPALTPGQELLGGSYVGEIGHGPYNRAYWSGPHLAIIADQKAASFLQWLSGE